MMKKMGNDKLEGDIRNRVRNIEELISLMLAEGVGQNLDIFQRDIESYLNSEEGRLRKDALEDHKH